MTTNLRRTASVVAFGLAALALAGGCGGPPRAQVKGTVTIDGKPLKDGSIEFFPVDGKGQSAGTSIHDGAYQVEASVGEMRVTINGTEVVGKRKAYDTPESPMIDVVRNAVPERYNTHSELKKTLTAGANELNFELKSEKKK
jgi:hypothetical protein